MIVRMIVTGLVALSLSSVPLSYSADRTPTPQTTRAAPASIQRPQSTHLPKGLCCKNRMSRINDGRLSRS